MRLELLKGTNGGGPQKYRVPLLDTCFTDILWEVEIRMYQLLCFPMSYQIVIVSSFHVSQGKMVGLFVTAAGIVLFVFVVGRVSALWDHRRSSSTGGVGLAGSST